MRPFPSKVEVKEEEYRGELPVQIRNLGVTFKAKKETVTAQGLAHSAHRIVCSQHSMPL